MEILDKFAPLKKKLSEQTTQNLLLKNLVKLLLLRNHFLETKTQDSKMKYNK